VNNYVGVIWTGKTFFAQNTTNKKQKQKHTAVFFSAVESSPTVANKDPSKLNNLKYILRVCIFIYKKSKIKKQQQRKKIKSLFVENTTTINIIFTLLSSLHLNYIVIIFLATPNNKKRLNTTKTKAHKSKNKFFANSLLSHFRLQHDLSNNIIYKTMK
jgi:hypothetical protein